MAKANLVLPGGTKVAIEGTADEVAGLLERFSDGAAAESPVSGPRDVRAIVAMLERVAPVRDENRDRDHRGVHRHATIRVPEDSACD